VLLKLFDSRVFSTFATAGEPLMGTDQESKPLRSQRSAPRSTSAALSHAHDLNRLRDAAVQLADGLCEALEHESCGQPSPENERIWYSTALALVAQFFITLFDDDANNPIGNFLGQRFFELGSGIADLNQGTVRRLLSPNVFQNRASEASDLWRARANVAVGLHALMRCGNSRELAAREIARRFKTLSRLAGKRRRREFWVTIVGWRVELMARRVHNFEAVTLFTEGAILVDGMSKAHDVACLRQFADTQLKKAAAFSRGLTA
jgi:hypothetical protein